MEQTLSIVIPARNAAATLGATLAAIAAAQADCIVVDAGSTDATANIAVAHRARVLHATANRGAQCAEGAGAATGTWLLFLHADTRPAPGWLAATRAFAADPRNARRAAYFRFALDDPAPQARRLERLVAWRCRVLALPYGDQGLLIAAEHYARLDGHRPLPLMEDVDLVCRLVRSGGRAALVPLPVAAVTSAERWRRDGWQRRSARNLLCLALWFMGVPPRWIARVYG